MLLDARLNNNTEDLLRLTLPLVHARGHHLLDCFVERLVETELGIHELQVIVQLVALVAKIAFDVAFEVQLSELWCKPVSDRLSHLGDASLLGLQHQLLVIC